MTRTFCATAALLVLLGAVATGSASTSRAGSGTNATALFEGEYVDLSSGWGAARACLVAESVGLVECFRTRTQMLARERRLAEAGARLHIPSFLGGSGKSGSAGAAGDPSCSAPLRLYANPWYGGRELDFYDRALWQNLSDWGFDNQASSYKVGACGADLADRANGTTPFAPSDTNAEHEEPYMRPGWDNRVSSIYIA
jgi:hypothetical protein